MAPIREIKKRKNSIASIRQLTKAMELVSTVKLQKTKKNANDSKPYFIQLHAVISSILSKTKEPDCKYLRQPISKTKAVIVMTSNRGLAGGYSTDVAKLITEKDWKKEELEIYTVGKKGREVLEKKGYKIIKDYSKIIQTPDYEEAKKITDILLQKFSDGTIAELYLAYTSFKNTVIQKPRLIRLLPVTMPVAENEKETVSIPMNYEPKEEEVLERIIPKYIFGMVYHAMTEAAASENAARMRAMDAASKNAKEITDKLSLQYNRVRQGSITQELTEIIAGAGAVN